MNTYKQFMEDYINEEFSPNELYLDLITEAAKDNVFKDNYIYRDKLQVKIVEPILKKKANQERIIEFTGSFIDKHEKELSTSGPVYIFTFSDRETKFFYELFGITGDKLIELFNEVVTETYYGSIHKFMVQWINNAPYKLLFVAIIIESLQKNYADMLEVMEYLFAFSEYPLIYRNFWKIGVREDIMDYTIEHLGSKFQVKKVKNLGELLKYDSHLCVENMKDRLLSGADNVYTDFMQDLKNRINNKFRNIANAYYINIENNNTQHTKSSQFDDGSLADQEGMNTIIATIVDSTNNKFSTSPINGSMVKAVAEGNKCDKDILTGFINQIWKSKDNRLFKLVENIITAYFNKYPTETNITNQFINFGLLLFRSIATSKDPIYNEIRDILDHWMYDIIDITSQYQNKGTIINYTRGVFNYVIWMIKYYN